MDKIVNIDDTILPVQPRHFSSPHSLRLNPNLSFKSEEEIAGDLLVCTSQQEYGYEIFSNFCAHQPV